MNYRKPGDPDTPNTRVSACPQPDIPQCDKVLSLESFLISLIGRFFHYSPEDLSLQHATTDLSRKVLMLAHASLKETPIVKVINY
jgi:hypothetical protein